MYGSIAGAEQRDGLITFVPLAETSAPAARTAIQQGRYEFDADTGPLPGRYRVEIRLVAASGNESTRRVKEVDVPVDQAGDLPLEYEAFPEREVDISADDDAPNLDFSL